MIGDLSPILAALALTLSLGCGKSAVVLSADGNEVVAYCSTANDDMVMCQSSACSNAGSYVLRGSDKSYATILRCFARDGGTP